METAIFLPNGDVIVHEKHDSNAEDRLLAKGVKLYDFNDDDWYCVRKIQGDKLTWELEDPTHISDELKAKLLLLKE